MSSIKISAVIVFEILYRIFTTGNGIHLITKTRQYVCCHLPLFCNIIDHQY